MLKFIATRILAAIPVLLILSVVTFGIIKAQPGDYADYLKSMLMSQGNMSNVDAQEQADAYRAAHGLTGPLPLQYLHWITGIVTRFDFGEFVLLQQAGRRRSSRSDCREPSCWR